MIPIRRMCDKGLLPRRTNIEELSKWTAISCRNGRPIPRPAVGLLHGVLSGDPRASASYCSRPLARLGKGPTDVTILESRKTPLISFRSISFPLFLFVFYFFSRFPISQSTDVFAVLNPISFAYARLIRAVSLLVKPSFCSCSRALLQSSTCLCPSQSPFQSSMPRCRRLLQMRKPGFGLQQVRQHHR